jgi:hypothetical protein
MAQEPQKLKSALEPPRPKMLIDLEGAHAFYVSIFGGVEHLRLRSETSPSNWCS